MLVRPWVPTMTWSWTVIFMCRPASTRSRVRRMSCWLGVGIAARVVVDDDQRGRAERDRAADDFADMDRGFVDRALPHRFVGDQQILGVEEQHAHFLDRRMGHRRLQIIAERLPARQQGPALDARFEQAQRGRLGDLERGDCAFAQAGAGKRLGVGRQQRPDPAELGDQLLRLRLGVAPRDGQREQIFDQLMIEQRLGAAFEQALAQPRAVARCAVGFRVSVARPCMPFPRDGPSATTKHGNIPLDKWAADGLCR